MPPLLFSSYPKLRNHIPYVSLADLPTSISKLEIRSKNSTINDIYIKRDDLTHKEYGGNKVRKLEFIIGEALSQNKTEIITFGATGTNHGVATALFCKKNNLKCTVILFDQPITKTVQNNLAAMAKLGAKLIYKKSLFSAALHFYWKQLTAKPHQYFLFAGGSNIAGCIGFVNAAFELKQQLIERKLSQPNYIYCPIGSSATLAGLTLGCFLANIETKVIGVRVAPSHVGVIPACTHKTITNLMRQTFDFIQHHSPENMPKNLPTIHMDNNYYGEGYGVATNEALAATNLFKQHGINLDATYTAKTAAALLAHKEKEPDKTFLYWHTFNSASMQDILNRPLDHCLPKSLQKVINATL